MNELTHLNKALDYKTEQLVRLRAAIRMYESDLNEKINRLNKNPYMPEMASAACGVASCLDLLHTMMREQGISYE